MKELMDSWTQFKADGFVFMILNIFVIFMALCGGIGIVCRIVRKRRESAGKAAGFEKTKRARRQLLDQQQLIDQQQAMADATGIEFGGNNCDPNLNPGLFHEQGGFNDGGDNDMFWGPFSF